jgi:3-methyladenine DNA glycosylase AlkD
LSTAKFIKNWKLRDSAVRASYVVSEILDKKIKLLNDREIIKTGIDAVAD